MLLLTIYTKYVGVDLVIKKFLLLKVGGGVRGEEWGFQVTDI